MKTRHTRFGNRPLLSLGTALVFLMAVPSAAFATHYLWATMEKGQVRFAGGQHVGDAPYSEFARVVDRLTPRYRKKTLTLGEAKDGARSAPLPRGQGVVTAEGILTVPGVTEESYYSTTLLGADDSNYYQVRYQVKGATSLAAAATLTKAPVELLARKEGQDLVVSLRKSGMPVPQTEVWVQWPGNKEESSLKTDEQGNARVAWPSTPHSGFVGIRALVIEDITTVRVEAYKTIQHWATLTFPLDSAKTH